MTPAIALATYIVLAAALFGLFWASSRRLDADTRAHMRRWIARAPAPTPEEGRGDMGRDRQWAESFIRWFDQAFAVRVRRVPVLGEIPLPSFRRSVLVSLFSLLVLALVWVSNKSGMGRAMAYHDLDAGNWDMIRRLLILYGGATLITNWIPDYLSLVESRMIIAKMAQAKSWTRRLGWLLVDAGATLAISFFAIHLSMVLLLPLVTPAMDIEVGCLTPASYSLATTAELFVSGLRFEGAAGTLNYDATGVYIYSTFLTSLWVWIYLIGGFVLRLVVGFAPLASWTEAARRQPLRAMGVLVVVGFSAVYWPSWLHRQAHRADVYIHHVDVDREHAELLQDELEDGGLRVQIAAEVEPELQRELLAKADSVIVLDSGESVGALDDEAEELEVMVGCGERPAGSTTRVHVLDPGIEQHYALAAIWRPGDDATELVRWAQRVSSIIAPWQIRECQALNPAYAPAPASCELRGAR